MTDQQMATSDVLYKAADLIDFDGWHQGGYAPDQTEDGTSMEGLPACALGALYKAAGKPLVWSTSVACWVGHGDLAAIDVLAGHVGSYVPYWNDKNGRTAEEVIEALRAAAVIEAAREEAPARTASDTTAQPAKVSGL